MSIEATAEALAPEQPVQVPEAAPETSENDELAAIFEKNQTEPAPDEAPVDDAPVEEPVQDEPAEAEPAKVEVPTTVPRQLRDQWANIPEDARTAVTDLVDETNRKLGEQGRLIQGISPIRDVLTQAVEQLPQLKDMKPEDVATQVFELAKSNAAFRENPAETLLGLIKQHKLEGVIAQGLQGQPMQDTTSQLRQTIEGLERQVRQLSDPDYLRSQVTAVTSEQATQGEVEKFAADAEHWGAVEDKLPAYVELMRNEMGESASVKDVLSSAYELAVSRLVPEDKKASTETAPAVETVDPEKAKAVIKAKSVNVSGKPGRTRVLSEDEELAAVFDRAQKK